MKLLNLDSIIIFSRPHGPTILTVCDDLYFKHFHKEICSSFLKNIKSYKCLHIHIIDPTDETLVNAFKLSSPRITISYEKGVFSNMINSVPKFDYEIWTRHINIDIKKMLFKEFFRDKLFFRKLISFFLKINLPITLYPPLAWLNKKRFSVYCACRRFLLPYKLFKNVNSLLVVDIDSILSADLPLNDFCKKNRSQAIFRKNSWSKCLAGIVFVHFEKKGKSRFLEMLSVNLLKDFSIGKIYWGLDQVNLDHLANTSKLFPLEFVSYSFEKNSDINNISFVSFKGDAKWN